MIGKEVDYSMLVDWTKEQFFAVLAPYLQKYGEAKKADILKMVGDHISEKLFRTYINQLRKEKMIKTLGEKNKMVYMLGDEYLLRNVIRKRAISLGMETLKEKGEI